MYVLSGLLALQIFAVEVGIVEGEAWSGWGGDQFGEGEAVRSDKSSQGETQRRGFGR